MFSTRPFVAWQPCETDLMLRVAAIQHDIVWENPDANMTHIRPTVQSVAADGAALVVLAEMWSTGFSMNAEVIAEAPDGPTATFMHDMASSTGVWIGGSFPERTDGHALPTNRFLLAGPNGEDHRYSKLRPFTYAGEHEHYCAGEQVVSVEIGGVRITPFVCYDLRFADLFWNAAANTDCYIVPANWPASRSSHWTTLLRARAIENQAYVVGVNRVGTGGGLDYSGDSRIFDPMGETTSAPAGAEAVITAEVDAERVAEVRAAFPFMQDR